MKCPIDQAELVMTERQGIEIDYCPTCRGVWLDRGELDKIIDRAAPATPAPQARAEPRRDGRYEDRRPKDRDHEAPRHDGRHSGKPYKKRGSFLSDIFDF